MSKLKLTEHIFLIFNEGELVLWNYKTHCQYKIDKETLFQLLQAAKGDIDEKKMLDLISEDIIIEDEEDIDWHWDKLSQIYHIGCNNIEEIEENNPQEWLSKYEDACKELKIPPNCLDISGKVIELPPHSLSNLPAKNPWEVSQQRMTNRVFTGNFVSLEEFTNILYAGFGVTHREIQEYKDKGYKQTFVRKAHPSGGGLHPIECFIVIYKVKGLSSGLYYYNWDKHILIDINKKITEEELIQLFHGQYYIKGIAFGIFLCNNNSKAWNKYIHSRCYRDLFVDLGHVQQTLLYYSTYMGISTWQSGWFKDGDLGELLQINDQSIFPTGFIGLGKGTQESIPNNSKRK